MQPIINNKQLNPKNEPTKCNSKDFVFIQRPWTWNPMLSASKTPASIENVIQRGDVLSLISPKNVNEFFIKRVIGLPGDIVKTIRYKEKYVLVPEG
jgi:signal peptidase I